MDILVRRMAVKPCRSERCRDSGILCSGKLSGMDSDKNVQGTRISVNSRIAVRFNGG